ncbi:hypothetical protein [Nonomuraea sediminis]|uniref:hypothetical protein n=1 Tax=Nonomuraea sediminis TaxID=2835864 RepID=UPI001BDD3FD9|nr:hypothetical protein [Nonomuraea sediminis]
MSGHHVDDYWQAVEYCHARGWTDGSPIVPPTAERVEEFLAHAGWDPAEVLAVEPVRGRKLPAEQVAACCVMAGCLPSYLPVMAAVLAAVSDPRYKLHGTVTSTGGAAPLIVVNGPIRDRIELNYRGDLFGSARRANATIGRALRLIFLNCLDARPGVLDRSTQGSFAKYSGCFGEYEQASPWEPFHVSRGFDAADSAVTVFAAESGHNILCHGTDRPDRLLAIAADTMAAMGSFSAGESLLVLSPEHAAILGAAGWSRADVREFLFQGARRRLADLKSAGKIDGAGEPDPGDEDVWVHRGQSPADIHVLVGGADAGGHSAFFPSWSRVRGSLAVTKGVRT